MGSLTVEETLKRKIGQSQKERADATVLSSRLYPEYLSLNMFKGLWELCEKRLS